MKPMHASDAPGGWRRSQGDRYPLTLLRLAFCCLSVGGILVAAEPGGSGASLLSLPSVSITQQPANQAVPLGGTAVFTVGATATGLVYTWYANGVPISGENASTLTVSNVQPQNAGLYYAQIMDLSGRVAAETDRAQLTIPSPDLVITAAPENQRVLLGTAAAFFVSASGSGPISYQWFHGGKLVSGATAPNLFVPATLEADAGTYMVRVSTPTAAILSGPAELSYALQNGVSITARPADQGVFVGGNARFEVSATGSGPLSYIWRHGAERIVGASGPALDLTGLQPRDAGDYWVTVKSSDGLVANAVARLSVYWVGINPIADFSLKEGTASSPIPITLIGAAESLATATLSAVSSNPGVVSADDILFAGSGGERLMVVVARPGVSGTARLALTAADRGQSATTELTVRVNGPNTSPIISDLIVPGSVVLGQVLTVPFKVRDNESDGHDLVVEAQLTASSAPGVVQVIGDRGDRSLVLKAESGAGSNLAVLLTVRDPAGATANQFISVPVAGPALQIYRDGPELVITYPESAPVGAMEYRYGVGEDQTWRAVGYVPSSSGAVRVVRIPVPINNTFFRLRF